ncbi:MAG: hypothetical protein ABI963_00255 [Rhizomicrobium sp.]
MRHTQKLLVATALAASVAMPFASPASAYVTCNWAGDCWHTADRIHFPGVAFTFHNDKWRDEHRSDKHYSWHDSDNDHDWHQGYWDHGSWHRK